jgi:hypothetical protein
MESSCILGHTGVCSIPRLVMRPVNLQHIIGTFSRTVMLWGVASFAHVGAEGAEFRVCGISAPEETWGWTSEA